MLKELVADMEENLHGSGPLPGGRVTAEDLTVGPDSEGVDVRANVRTTQCADAGSNSSATVEHSRKRLLGLIRAYSQEVRVPLDLRPLSAHFVASAADSGCGRLQLHDVPLFMDLGEACSVLRLSSPPMLEVQAALGNAGYRVRVLVVHLVAATPRTQPNQTTHPLSLSLSLCCCRSPSHTRPHMRSRRTPLLPSSGTSCAHGRPRTPPRCASQAPSPAQAWPSSPSQPPQLMYVC